MAAGLTGVSERDPERGSEMGSIICYNLILEEMSRILVIRGSHGQLRPVFTEEDYTMV